MSFVSRGNANAFEIQEVSYQTCLFIYFVVQFLCWALLEFLEHQMGMQPAIRRRSSFSRMADANTSNSRDRRQYAMTQRRLTKTLGIVFFSEIILWVCHIHCIHTTSVHIH